MVSSFDGGRIGVGGGGRIGGRRVVIAAAPLLEDTYGGTNEASLRAFVRWLSSV